MWQKDIQPAPSSRIDPVSSPAYENYLLNLSRSRSQRNAPLPIDPSVRKSLGDNNPPLSLSGRVQPSPLRSSVSQVLQSSAYDRNASQFFGVTPLQPAQPEYTAGKRVPKDPAWNLAQGYAEDGNTSREEPRNIEGPAGKKVLKDQEWKIGFGYSPETEQEKAAVAEAPQRVKVTSKATEDAIAAGKKIQKDQPWSLNIGYTATVHKGSSPVKVLQTAGFKIQKEDPWKLSEGYSENPTDKQTKADSIPSEPAGKKVQKDPIWSFGESNGLHAYRRSSEYVAFTPDLKSKAGSYQSTAGKKIPRDQPFSIAHEKPHARYRSLTPQPS